MSAIVNTLEFPEIDTERLSLAPVTRESLLCQVGFGPTMATELGAILQAEIPAAWPQENWEAHVLAYLLNLIAENQESVGWCRYLLLRQDGRRILIGTFGAGFPSVDRGESEIGYGLLPAWQRQGFAAEAVTAMLPWLQQRRPIEAFVAQTFPHFYGSVRVLEKCGFMPAGNGLEAETILLRRPCPLHA